MTYDEAFRHCILRYVSGSHAYGFNRPDSDEDIRGVFIAPLSQAFALFQTSFMGQGAIGQQLKGAVQDIEAGDYEAAKERIRQSMESDQGDLSTAFGTIHKPGADEELQELRKFMKLAADCNPNIIEFLWVDRLIKLETEAWKMIRAKRDLFLSKKARWTFAGYAFAQLKRIKVHRGYLLNPPAKKPERRDYGLSESFAVPSENQNAILSLPTQYVQDDVKDEVVREKQYRAALEDWKAYQKWERERNPARKEMEAKFGYDAKHATHLVRLIRQGKEILSEGVVRVWRPDHDELASIREGAWPYEKVVEVAETADAELDELYKKSTLRDKPDHKGIAALYVEVCEREYGIKLG